MYVTPGEQLRVNVGGSAYVGRGSDSCTGGGGGTSTNPWSGQWCGPGGSASSVERYDVVFNTWSVLAVAGAGGGGCYTNDANGRQGMPATGVPVGGCGVLATSGASSCGGGWQGGQWQGPNMGGSGGTSCAPGILASTLIVMTAADPLQTVAMFEASDAWLPGVGRPEGPGLAVLSWSNVTIYDPAVQAALSNSPSPSLSATPTGSVGSYCDACADGSSVSICCDCCSDGVYFPGLCNDLAHADCLLPASLSFTYSSSSSAGMTPSNSQTLLPSQTGSPTRTPSRDSSPSSAYTPTSSQTPDPAAGAPMRSNHVAFNLDYACSHMWTVPAGTRSIVVQLWGAGGGGAGGAGAFLQGLIPVTPGESLRITVGSAGQGGGSVTTCNSGARFGEGGAGAGYYRPWNNLDGFCASGGSATIIERSLSIVGGSWQTLAIAGGGGGGCDTNSGGGGLGISPLGCGLFAPQGGSAPPYGSSFYTNQDRSTRGGGGGGGWIGGLLISGQLGGTGGTSCAPGLLAATVTSIGADESQPDAGRAIFEHAKHWREPAGRPGGGGLAVLSWGVALSPTTTSSSSQTPGPTTSDTASQGASPVPTASVSPSAGSFCSLCALDPSSLCCDCCWEGAWAPSRCNDVRYVSCLAAPTTSWTRSSSPTRTATATITQTASQTSSSSAMSSSSATYTTTPLPSLATGLPILTSSATFATEGCNIAWLVPENISIVNVRMWGAGGGSSRGYLGGGGAYVEGSALVTPGESLYINVAQRGGGDSSCSGGGGSPYSNSYPASCGSGGGASSITRWSTAFENWEIISIAGGGGGACNSGRGAPARGQQGDCGVYSPTGGGQTVYRGGDWNTNNFGGGGGGGWIGGSFWGNLQPGGGGTSCSPGLLVTTVTSLDAIVASDNVAIFEHSPYWRSPAARADGGGLVELSWGLEVSPSTLPTSSSTPTPSPYIPVFDCSLCADGEANLCCDCCTGSPLTFTPALCNSMRYVYANCFTTPLPTPSVSPSSTATPSKSSDATVRPLPTTMQKVSFSGACGVVWTVPAGVRQISLLLWGSGGESASQSANLRGWCYNPRNYDGVRGAPGAFLQGAAYVTPGDQLRVTAGRSCSGQFVGGGANLGSTAPGGACVRGSSASWVERYDNIYAVWQVIAVAGAGGSVCGTGFSSCCSSWWGSSCGPALSSLISGRPSTVDSSLCGGTSTPSAAAGGGGGWIGGTAGAGGSSCGPGLINETVTSLVAPLSSTDGAAIYRHSPSWISPAGSSDADGLIVISWGTPLSSSTTSSASASPTPSPSPSATPVVNGICSSGSFRAFPSSDLVGSPAGSGELLLSSSESACQRLCCTTAGCDGYSFSAALLAMSGGAAAPCYLMSNVTQVRGWAVGGC